jgi:uncharacterized membrane protein YhaH (DUF805 family)
MAFIFALSFLGPPALQLALIWVVLSVETRRLHDFGRSGWWAWGCFALSCLPIAFMTVAPRDDIEVVAAAISLVAIVVIGAIPGNPGENRFGPPPPFTARRLLIGR